MLKDSQCNWFEFLEKMEQSCQCGDSDVFLNQMESVYSQLLSTGKLQEANKTLLQQSHEAYLAERNCRVTISTRGRCF